MSDGEKSMEINGWKYDYESLDGWDARDKITNLNSLTPWKFLIKVDDYQKTESYAANTICKS